MKFAERFDPQAKSDRDEADAVIPTPNYVIFVIDCSFPGQYFHGFLVVYKETWNDKSPEFM